MHFMNSIEPYLSLKNDIAINLLTVHQVMPKENSFSLK